MFVGIFFILLAGAITAVIWYAFRLQTQLFSEGIVAQGTVVDTATHSVRLPDGGSTTQQMLVLEWMLPDGQTARAQAPGDPRRHPVGQPLTLRYVPGNPPRAMIDGERPRLTGLVIMGIVAALLFVAGVFKLRH